MKTARAGGFESIAFTGGEPTIRKDLLGLVKAARAQGFSDVKVQTNGLLLASAAKVARLIDHGVTRVHLSIHTHRADRYDALVRSDGSHGSMVRALELLAARPEIELVVDVILKSDTFRDLPDAIDWLATRGVRNADLWFVSLTDGNRDNVASMPRMTEVVPFMHDAFERGDRQGMRLRSLHVPRCLLGDDRARAFDPAAGMGHARVMVLSPDDFFELSASKLTPSVYVPACEGCPDRGPCRGLRPDYVERYGDAEVAAARRTAMTRPGRALKVVP
jgi:MoaA/NifB/PqqE/SkfB family radical SAM enzyme